MSIPSDPTGATPEGAVPPPPAGAVPPPAYNAPPPGYSAPPPGYAAPAPGYGAPVAPMSESDQRLWAMLAHLGGILFGFLASLIIWLVYKDKSRFVEEQAKEALNFQITIAIAMIVSSILVLILIGIVLMIVVGIADLVLCIMAGLAANKGQAYRYPFALRLIK